MRRAPTILDRTQGSGSRSQTSLEIILHGCLGGGGVLSKPTTKFRKKDGIGTQGGFEDSAQEHESSPCCYC